MGYSTSLTGSITVNPPLTHTELTGTPWTDFEHDHPAGAFSGGWHAVRLAVTEASTETEQGTVTVRTAAAIEPVEDSYSGNTPDNVQAAVSAIVEAFPGHQFAGHIEGDGESPLDVWRVVARGREVATVEPTITWPGEAEQPTDALPSWGDLSDVDKGCALLHAWKVDQEGRDYAVENYPAKFHDHPDLTALQPIEACAYVDALNIDLSDNDAVLIGDRELSWDEYQRLYDLALDAD